MKVEGQGSGLFNAGGGTIELTEEGVRIDKKNTNMAGGGLLGVAVGLATATKGGLLIPYVSIHSVSVNSGGLLSPPFIQVLMGGDPPISDAEKAQSTPSCILFKKGAMAQFQQLKSEIEKRAASARSKSANGGNTRGSEADEIAKLAELLDRGHLTQAEFDGKKKAILGL